MSTGRRASGCSPLPYFPRTGNPANGSRDLPRLARSQPLHDAFGDFRLTSSLRDLSSFAARFPFAVQTPNARKSRGPRLPAMRPLGRKSKEAAAASFDSNEPLSESNPKATSQDRRLKTQSRRRDSAPTRHFNFIHNTPANSVTQLSQTSA